MPGATGKKITQGLASSPAAMMEVWYDRNDPVLQDAVAELFQLNTQFKTIQMMRFDNEISGQLRHSL